LKADFYSHLLDCLKRDDVRKGNWHLSGYRSAWDGNPTWENFIVFSWQGQNGQRLLVCANYGPTQGQCYAEIPFGGIQNKKVILKDLMGQARYERDGNQLQARGLYLDMPSWGYHIFDAEIA
jgi:hypothetical protein